VRVRAKTNGNVLDLPDGEAEALIAAGIYEREDVSAAPVTKEMAAQKSAGGARHKRKDLRAEE
jgi:hypothetical protein